MNIIKGYMHKIINSPTEPVQFKKKYLIITQNVKCSLFKCICQKFTQILYYCSTVLI